MSVTFHYFETAWGDKAKEEIKKKKYRKHFQISSTFTEKSKNLLTPKS